jgi:hypothetical protein
MSAATAVTNAGCDEVVFDTVGSVRWLADLPE